MIREAAQDGSETEVIITSHSSYTDVATRSSVVETFEKVKHFERFYPNFEAWYWETVVPGFGNGTRSIECVRRGGELVGLCILKHSDEQKICTLWVADRFVGTGMGVRLLQASARRLGGRPLATVPEERYGAIGPALISLGFTLTEVVEGYYRPSRKEYAFNGYLRDWIA